jgi:MFS family permease
LDRFGRKSSLIFGGFLTALSLGSVHWITDLGSTAYSVRIVFGIAEGFIFTGYFALATDLIPERRRTEGLALFGVSGLLPLLVNPLSDLFGFQGAELRLFITSVGILVVGAALLIFLIPKPKMKSDRSSNTPRPDQALQDTTNPDSTNQDATIQDMAELGSIRYLTAAPLRPLWWSTIAFAGGVSLMMTFASVVGEARGMTLPTATWFTYVAGAVVARLFGAKLPERLGPARLVLPSLFLYGSALLTCALSTNTMGMLCAGALAGVAHGYAFPVLTSLIVSAVHEHYRGRALAMFTGLWGAAAVVFALVGGLIADRWSDEHMLGVFGIILICVALYARPYRFKDSMV